MEIINDELWKHPGFPGMIIVTTNSSVRRDDGLVMGRGSAGEAANRIPYIEFEATKAIRAKIHRIQFDGMDYGFVVVREPTDTKVGLGIFQTKRGWRETSTIETISKSIEDLRVWTNAHPSVHIRMPFPGIGCGQIGWGTVPSPDEILNQLSALRQGNITICVRNSDADFKYLTSRSQGEQ